jgi:threonine aldolase
VFNAAVKLGVPVDTITRQFDSVSVCLSKGLGAPVGSLLAGSTGFVREARRWRKVVGGGMRQAGILAAAGIMALERQVERLAEDHDNALRLASGLLGIDGVDVDPRSVHTNMVFVSFPPGRVDALVAFLGDRGIVVSNMQPMRLVTHLDVSAAQIDYVIARVTEFCEQATVRSAAG